MPKVVKEFMLRGETGEVNIEYDDNSTSSFNLANAVTQQGQVIQKLVDSYERNINSALAQRIVMTSPPTVTDEGSSLPVGQTKAYTYLSTPDFFRVYGGEAVNTAAGQRFKSATIAATGGNIGTNDGKNASYWRICTVVDSTKVTFRVGPTTTAYRFIVDGQYVSLTGTVPSVTTGNTSQYISLTFTSRAKREVIIEGQMNGSFVGIYVGPTETLYQAPASDINAVILGDSYVYGSTASNLGDGYGRVLGDCLGIRNIVNSGSGGTGWSTSGNYRFDQRVITDVIARNPNLVFLQGSYNDNSGVTVDITSRVLYSLKLIRASLPQSILFVFGAFPGATGPSAGIIAAEQAVKDAVTTFNDPFCKFIPFSTNQFGAKIAGTGKIGSTNASGNSDVYTDTDGVHPPTAGHSFIGRTLADDVVSDLKLMLNY